jgi:hypothetical protein
MEVSRVALGPDGHDYVAGRVGAGLTLSSVASTLIDLSAGTTFTWSANPFSEDLLDFGRGDVVVDGGDAPIVALVRTVFATAPMASLWVEESNPRRSDPFWDDPAMPGDRKAAWFLGEEVYSLAFPDDADETILRALNNGWWWAGYGGASYLSSAPLRDRYKTEHEIAESDLRPFVEATRYIICGAYDGEGWVVWERADGVVR